MDTPGVISSGKKNKTKLKQQSARTKAKVKKTPQSGVPKAQIPYARVEEDNFECFKEVMISIAEWITDSLKAAYKGINDLVDATFVPQSMNNVVQISFLDYVLDKLNQVDYSETQRFIDKVQSCPFPKVKSPSGHTHGYAAGCRTAVNAYLDSLADTSQHVRIDLQTSRKVAENNYGVRSLFWPSDLKCKTKNDLAEATQKDHFYTMIDCDYYIPMDQITTTKPMLCYTFQPRQAAGRRVVHVDDKGRYYDNGKDFLEAQYTFNENNELVMVVNGGNTYNHKVWDWNTDGFTTSRFESWHVFSYRTCMYRVNQYNVSSEDWGLVLITPVARYGLIGSLALWLLSKIRPESNFSKPLKRFEPVVGDLILVNKLGHEHGASIALVNSYTAKTVTGESLDAVRAYRRRMESEVTFSGVSQRLEHPERTFVADLLSAKPDNDLTGAIVNDAARMLVYHPPTLDAPKPVMIPVGPQFTEGYNCIPARCPESNAQAVNERILGVRGEDTEPERLTAQEVQVDSKVVSVFKQFLEWFPKGTVVPYSDEQVAQSLKTKSQVRLYQTGTNLVAETQDYSDTFMKAESYQKLQDPRIITVSEPYYKLKYARFQLAVAEVLRQHPWFIPGKTPVEIAEHVAKICVNAEFVQAGDFSRMDGRVNMFARHLEMMFLKHVFHPSYWKEVLEAYSDPIGRTCLMVNIFYCLGFARASGSAETTNHNTLLTIFILYLCYHNLGYKHKDILNIPAAANGDDSLAPDIPDKTFSYCSKLLGQVAESQTIAKGDIGVNFLARFYGRGVWLGDPNSMCDLARSLPKLSITTSLPQKTPTAMETRFAEKLVALSFTDSNTPLISNLISAYGARRCYRKAKTELSKASPDQLYVKDLGWWSQFQDKSTQYPNDVVGFADEYLELWNIESVTQEKQAALTALFDPNNSWEMICKSVAPILVKRKIPPPKVHSVVAGELVQGEKELKKTKDPMLKQQKDVQSIAKKTAQNVLKSDSKRAQKRAAWVARNKGKKDQ